MRVPPGVRSAALVAPLLFVLCSCSDEQPLSPSITPTFNHVRAPSSTIVDVNNLRVQVDADGLRHGFRDGRRFLFAGGIAYGTGPEAVVWWDSRRSASGLIAASDQRVLRPGPIADHQTVSILADARDQLYGPNTPPRAFVIQETFAFSATADANYLIVKYTLYNPGPDALSGLYVGQALDLDLTDEAWNNAIQFVPYEQSLRVWYIPDNYQAGHILLSDPLTTMRIWRNANSPVEPNDPDTWSEVFAFLSGGIGSLQFDVFDVRDLLGHGPVSLAPHASRAFAFAMAADAHFGAVGDDIAAARSRYDALPAAARNPYPVAPVGIAIAPRALNLDAPGVMLAQLAFASAGAARLFDGASARCAGAAPTRVHIQQERVQLLFDRAAVDAQRVIGGRIVCAGFLSDGTAWVGDDTVTISGGAAVLTPVSQLTSGPANDNHAEWSPDGTAIVFDSDRSGATGIYRMDLAAGESSIVPLASAGRWPDWSPDGATIVFVDPTGPSLLAVPAAGGVVTALPFGAGQPAWSPDGARIAGARAGGTELWVSDVGSGASHIVASAGVQNMYPHWSNDGLLYFVTRGRADDTTSAIYGIDPDLGEPSARRVTPIEGVANSAPAVSPNGRILAFGSSIEGVGRQLVLQNLRTGEHTVVRFDGPAPGIQDRVEWSPDGGRLLFASGGDVYVVDMAAVLQRMHR